METTDNMTSDDASSVTEEETMAPLLDASAGRAEFMEPLPSSPLPPVTPPPPAEQLTDPPALRRRLNVRTFCAARAGSDTEEETNSDDDYDGGSTATPDQGRCLPVPTSPLVRQVGRSDFGAAIEHVVADSEAEADAEADGVSEAGEDADDEAELEPATGVEVFAPNGMVVQIPVWLFVTMLILLFIYLFLVLYVLTLPRA